jgi:hypothetical protein
VPHARAAAGGGRAVGVGVGVPLVLSRYLKQRTKNQTLSSVVEMFFSVSYLCAHRDTREQVPPKPLSSTIPARGVRQLGFWGATSSAVERFFPVSYLYAHRDTREQVPLMPLLSTISAWGVRQLDF